MKIVLTLQNYLSILLLLTLHTFLGCNKKGTKTQLNQPNQSTPPSIAFTFSYSNITSGRVDFTASGSTDAALNWDFGDGTTASGVTPSHTYSTIGVPHNVVLTATNDAGTDSESQTIIPKYADGTLTLYTYHPGFFNDATEYVSVTVTSPTYPTQTGTIHQSQFMPDCYENGTIWFKLPPGTYTIEAYKSFFNKNYTGSAVVTSNDCKIVELVFP